MFNRRLQKFYNRLENRSIVEYFDLEDNNTEFTINIKEDDNCCNLFIRYYKPGIFFEFPNLPYEMNRYISHFTQTLVELKIKIQPPIHYPFNPAIWSLVESKSITCCNLDVREHFEYLISVHNYKYTLSWSAVIHFEKDLLIFISAIKPSLEYL